MSPEQLERLRLREAFQRSTYLPVRVSPTGFELQEHHYKELHGRVLQTSLNRRLFEEGTLACRSADGITAENGTSCGECLHPRCQPRLRLELAFGKTVFVLDLAPTSARNLFALEDRAEAEGARLIDWSVKLAVTDRGNWGEVTFERISPPSTAS